VDTNQEKHLIYNNLIGFFDIFFVHNCIVLNKIIRNVAWSVTKIFQIVANILRELFLLPNK